MKLSHLAAVLVLGAVVSAPLALTAAGPKGKGRETPAKQVDVTLIKELQHIRHLLSKADRDYKGHRAKAVEEIHDAVKNLRQEAHARGHKAPDAYKGPEPQPVS